MLKVNRSRHEKVCDGNAGYGYSDTTGWFKVVKRGPKVKSYIVRPLKK